MKPVSAVIFDFDGTLVRLKAGPPDMQQLRSALRELFAETGVRYEFRPLYPDLDRALAGLRQQEEYIQERMFRRTVETIERYERRFSKGSELCEYAREAWSFASEGWQVGVLSNNTTSCVRQALVDHGLWSGPNAFPLVGFEDVKRHKPNPDGLVKMVELLQLSGDDLMVYVGDHVSDLETCERFNRPGGTCALAVCVRGGKCAWNDVAAHPYFRHTLALSDLSELPRVMSRAAVGSLDPNWRSSFPKETKAAKSAGSSPTVVQGANDANR